MSTTDKEPVHLEECVSDCEDSATIRATEFQSEIGPYTPPPSPFYQEPASTPLTDQDTIISTNTTTSVYSGVLLPPDMSSTVSTLSSNNEPRTDNTSVSPSGIFGSTMTSSCLKKVNEQLMSSQLKLKSSRNSDVSSEVATVVNLSTLKRKLTAESSIISAADSFQTCRSGFNESLADVSVGSMVGSHNIEANSIQREYVVPVVETSSTESETLPIVPQALFVESLQAVKRSCNSINTVVPDVSSCFVRTDNNPFRNGTASKEMNFSSSSIVFPAQSDRPPSKTFDIADVQFIETEEFNPLKTQIVNGFMSSVEQQMREFENLQKHKPNTVPHANENFMPPTPSMDFMLEDAKIPEPPIKPNKYTSTTGSTTAIDASVVSEDPSVADLFEVDVKRERLSFVVKFKKLLAPFYRLKLKKEVSEEDVLEIEDKNILHTGSCHARSNSRFSRFRGKFSDLKPSNEHIRAMMAELSCIDELKKKELERYLPKRDRWFRTEHGPPPKGSRYHICPGATSAHYELFLDSLKMTSQNGYKFRQWYYENNKVVPPQFRLPPRIWNGMMKDPNHSGCRNLLKDDRVFSHIPDQYIAEFYLKNPQKLLVPGALAQLSEMCSVDVMQQIKLIFHLTKLGATLKARELSGQPEDKQYYNKLIHVIYAETEDSISELLSCDPTNHLGAIEHESSLDAAFRGVLGKKADLIQLVQVLDQNREFVNEYYSRLMQLVVPSPDNSNEPQERFITESKKDWNKRISTSNKSISHLGTTFMSNGKSQSISPIDASSPSFSYSSDNVSDDRKIQNANYNQLSRIFYKSKIYACSSKEGLKYRKQPQLKCLCLKVDQRRRYTRKHFFGFIKPYHPRYHDIYDVDDYDESDNKFVRSIVLIKKKWKHEAYKPHLYIPNLTGINERFLMEYLHVLSGSACQKSEKAGMACQRELLDPNTFSNKTKKKGTFKIKLAFEEFNSCCLKFGIEDCSLEDTFAIQRRGLKNCFEHFIHLLVKSHVINFHELEEIKVWGKNAPNYGSEEIYHAAFEYFTLSPLVDFGFVFLDFAGIAPAYISRNRVLSLTFDRSKGSLAYIEKLKEIIPKKKNMSEREKKEAKIKTFQLGFLKLLCSFLHSRYISKYILRSLLFQVDNNLVLNSVNGVPPGLRNLLKEKHTSSHNPTFAAFKDFNHEGLNGYETYFDTSSAGNKAHAESLIRPFETFEREDSGNDAFVLQAMVKLLRVNCDQFEFFFL